MNNKIRDLGHIESLMTVMHEKLGGNTQGAQLVGIKGKIDFEHFKQATKSVFDKYAALRCTIQKMGDKLCYISHNDFSKVPVTHIHLDGDTSWYDILENEVNDIIDPAILMWRAVLLTGQNADESKIIVSVHHSIVDGTGVFVLLEDILKNIDNIMQGTNLDTEQLDFPDPIDNYLLPPSKEAPSQNIPDSPKIYFKKNVEMSDRRTKMHISNFSEQETKLLESYCKDNRMSINSILSAALCVASVKNGCGEKSMPFKTAVSLRDRVDDTIHKLGCYIAVADTTLDVTSSDLVTIAKEYDRKLLSYMLKVLIRKQNGTLEKFTNIAQNIREHDYFDHGIAITNAGAVQAPIKYNNFELDDWHTINNRQAGNFAVVLHTLKFNNMIKYGLVYSDPIMSTDTVEKISVDFTKLLKQLIQNSEENPSNTVASKKIVDNIST